MIIKHIARWVVSCVLLAAAGCQQSVPPGPLNDIIVVAEFGRSQAVVTLDPSFGFSLYRGSPGVPQSRRATSIGNAVAFLVSDTVTQTLHDAGYEAASTTDPNPRVPGRALIVSGAFRQIDEGHRRHVGAENSSVVVDVQVRATGPGASGQPLLSLHLDSRTLPPAPPRTLPSRRETGINADAARVGDAIARAVIDIARHNNWTVVAR